MGGREASAAAMLLVLQGSRKLQGQGPFNHSCVKETTCWTASAASTAIISSSGIATAEVSAAMSCHTVFYQGLSPYPEKSLTDLPTVSYNLPTDTIRL